MIWVILAVVTAVVLFVLHYGYKLAFYYEDPMESPYSYGDNDQTRKCKAVLDSAIGEFEAAPYEDVSIVSHDGLKLTGRYYHRADGAPLQILCHGYKGNAVRDFCGIWKIAVEAGHNVLLINERSHGGSQGHTITFGILERQDCLAWVDYAVERFGRDAEILLYGVSMGATTVLMASALALPDNVKGIVADCPYSSPSAIIRSVCGKMHYPPDLAYPFVVLGARLFGHFSLNATTAAEAVKLARVPILILHGEADGFVPAAMSEEIHAACQERVQRFTFPGADHGISFLVDEQRYRRIVTEFVRSLL